MARNIAIKEGINYCYVGNVHNIEGQTTYCPKCNEPGIIRDWHSVLDIKMKDGKCTNCSKKIAGIF
jgi:pyruvate formate lyase activating enzyme